MKVEKPSRLERNIRVLNVSTFLSGIHRMAIYVILQPFVLTLQPSMVFVGLLQGIGGRNGLVTTIVQPVSGWISDRRGRKSLIVLGSILTAASLLIYSLAGFVSAAFLLVPSAVLMGLSAIRQPAESSVVAESVKKNSRGYTYSLLAFAMSVPGVFAPYLGGLAADELGFASVFLAAAIIEGCCLTLLFLYLKETRESKRKGSLDIDDFALFLRRIVVPPRRLRGIYIVAAMDSIMWGFGGYILMGLLSKNFGFTGVQLGLLSTMSSVSWALFQIPVGWLIHRHGCKAPLILSEAFGIIAMVGFALSTNFEGFLIFQIPLGLVPALWVPAQNTFIANATAETERAEAFGSLWLLKGVMGFPSPIIGGLLYNSLGFQAPLTASIIGIALDTILIYFLIHEKS